MNFSDNFSINKKNNNWARFLVGAIALLFFIAGLNFFSSGAKNMFYALSAPLQKTFWTAGESSSSFLASLVNAGNLNQQNQNLKNENQRLQAEVASLQSIVSGNQAQSAVSSACQNSGFILLMAGVIGLDNQDMMTINKGLDDGIAENMPVINKQGALFGRVFKVYKRFSEVMLISNKNSVINVKVQRQDSEIDGIAKGRGKFDVYLDLVSIDDTINQGDVLVTSALEGIFPKDLLVGTVANIEKNDQDPHQSSQIVPFLDSSADNLFVITNYKR
jgi:rod shape-determining protein MreC